MADIERQTVITDLTISLTSLASPPPNSALNPTKWHRIQKDLFLHSSEMSAWLIIAQAKESDLAPEDLVVANINVGKPTVNEGLDDSRQSRPGGIWISRKYFSGNISQVVTGIDVLFGVDAVDPRQQWQLMRSHLELDAAAEVPVARLSVRHGRAKSRDESPHTTLRVRENGTFKIVQISDTHMVTGVGSCKDAINSNGQFLPESVADPLTVRFLEEMLDIEKPDLVLLTGDQVHHDIPDTQSALFKVVAPLIERSIPFAAVFGNHDSEGAYALSRTAQMGLLRDLPFSLCQPGPEQIDGVGNYYLQVFASQLSVLDLFLFDSHEQIPSDVQDPDYGPIRPSQIDWYRNTSRQLREERESKSNGFHAPLAFLHIPIPEFGADELVVKAGSRREPTEGPSRNTHLYDALAAEGVAAIGCGHDHVNNFCAILPRAVRDPGNDQIPMTQHGPWLCYGGGSGFGGYCSYGKERFHRRTRVWELNAGKNIIKTWARVEYARDRVDELVLVDDRAV